MKFGIWPSPNWSWEEIHELAAHCQRTGWDAVYFADHFMPNVPEGAEPVDGDTIECWSVLAALAATVPRVRLAPLSPASPTTTPPSWPISPLPRTA